MSPPKSPKQVTSRFIIGVISTHEPSSLEPKQGSLNGSGNQFEVYRVRKAFSGLQGFTGFKGYTR